MKNKTIILVISTFLIFANTISSFANPLVIAPVTISYNSLMALMGIGVAFGVALPKNDEEYWDYTRSLRDHLNLVDEKYLERLDKIVGEWKTNNDNKPDNEKEPLKVPFIPGLDKLFQNIGNDVSKKFEYVNTILDPLQVYYDSTTYRKLLPTHTINDGDKIAFSIEGKHLIIEKNSSFTMWYESSNPDAFSKSYWGSGLAKIAIVYRKDHNSYELAKFYGNDNINTTYGIPYITPSDSFNPITKPGIEYTPTNPSVDSDNNISIEMPNVAIPNPESIPGTLPGLNPKPPFNVEFNTEAGPESPPGTNPETPPGTDTNFPSFPSFGDSLDFSPMYLTNVTEKFPFSLPWDIGRLIEKFDVDPVPPVFEVPIFSETITLDLTEFSELSSIVRFFVLVGFILSLIFISTKLMV